MTRLVFFLFQNGVSLLQFEVSTEDALALVEDGDITDETLIWSQQGNFPFGTLPISHLMTSFLPRFHPKQVHFEELWLKRVAI